MSGALCIDFGTSSIRVVRRMPNFSRVVLEIGRQNKSTLDSVSIQSAIHIDTDCKYIRYGERAVSARKLSADCALYEASPKLWLGQPEKLSIPVLQGMRLSREDVLTGLLANGLAAAVRVMDIGERTLRALELRVAHPVWPAAVNSGACAALGRMLNKAKRMAFDGDWTTVTANKLKDALPTEIIWDERAGLVLEPIAAAVELLPSTDNVRRVCLLVDVGAGTTDIGLFEGVAPDSNSSVRQKLYLMGQPVSLFKAGDYLDSLVLEEFTWQKSTLSQAQLSDLRFDIRRLKETIFTVGYAQAVGARVSQNDVSSSVGANEFVLEIRASIQALINNEKSRISSYLGASVNRMDALEIVMSGGGASIPFLCEALEKPFTLGELKLPVRLIDSSNVGAPNLYGATRERLAVALGGASEQYELCQHQRPELRTIRRGSY
ncbi:hypothetical protein [Limnohabitans sp. 2KL-1]|uniref:hypothetical protein n=1 Tax=Limnohabitans sp. 2KL-1 TaxID=1100699 RepID=UPI0011B21B90|nr:hypothetical protein [Limnohabitans sp. 2KL-1]